MKVIKMNEIKGEVNKRGVTARQLLKNEDVHVMNLILEPGDTLPSR
ncbi:MAG: hypothetical protein ACOCZX_00905 [Candidatus Bipolaricaulota bacterium]